MFDERKAAQAAAFLLDQASGKRMPLLKLMKLLYLADRRSIDQFGHPITFDAMVSMPHGPVLSQTLDLINGATESKPEGWEHWIADRAEHQVSVRRGVSVSRDSLLDLSDADVDTLATTWAQFGQMTKWQLRDYTHQHCPEWKDPAGSSNPIRYQDVLVALNKSPEQVQALTERRNTQIGIRRRLHAG